MLTPLINLSTQAGRIEFCGEEIDRIRDLCEILVSHLESLEEITAASTLVTVSEGLRRIDRVLNTLSQKDSPAEWGVVGDLPSQSPGSDRIVYCRDECDHLRSLCEVLVSHLRDRQEQASYQVVRILIRSLQDVRQAIDLMEPRS